MSRKGLAAAALSACFITLLSFAGARAEDKEPHDGHHASHPALAKFSALAGEWVGRADHDGQEIDAKVTYRVTSGGTAIVETIDPGGKHEMITVIHPDGDTLLLTHYCMIGNQPQMRAKPKADDGQVAFDFVRLTNGKPEKGMHMHSVTYTFTDKDTLKAEWTNYLDGKPAGKALFMLKRKK